MADAGNFIKSWRRLSGVEEAAENITIRQAVLDVIAQNSHNIVQSSQS
jgi:predicted XRE-type DNA-binding protein